MQELLLSAVDCTRLVMLGAGKYIPLTYFSPVPSPIQVQITIAKLKRYKSLGIDQILAALIQAGGETL
jgi:hypothetical protein